MNPIWSHALGRARGEVKSERFACISFPVAQDVGYIVPCDVTEPLLRQLHNTAPIKVVSACNVRAQHTLPPPGSASRAPPQP